MEKISARFYEIGKKVSSAFRRQGLDFISLSPLQDEQLRSQSLWFVHLRWLAIFVAAILLFIMWPVLDVLPRAAHIPLVFCILLLAICNFEYRRLSATFSQPYRLILIQGVDDLFFLTVFLHFSGGLENPLFVLYIIHVIITGILMLPKDCYLIASVSGLLLSFMAIGEFTHIIRHHHINKFTCVELNPLYLMVHLVSFTGILFITAYFTTLIVRQFRRSQERLYQAGKLAALGELVGQVAHEINNPIAIISAKTKLLTNKVKEGNSREKILYDLQKIDRHAERIASLITNLLTFCRPSVAKKTVIDVNHVVETTLNLIDLTIFRDIFLKINLSKEPLFVRGNFNEIQQVILNIVNNAIDAMSGGGQLTVDVKSQDNYAIVVIEDNGEGIPPENIARIFDPFFSTKLETKGTGLGLSISNTIVKDHNGYIGATSMPGHGSMFTIKIPLI